MKKHINIFLCIVITTILFCEFDLPSFCNNLPIPNEWLTFMPRKIPFIPFSNIDYFKIYSTPVDVNKYAGAGREYNKNYKPYYPEKYLYVTDYSYNHFIKETKNSGTKEDNQFEYNNWLWEKIRSDFKKVHGMYNATVTDKYGIKHKITWEDGGIVSIYEQYKLFYEYAIVKDSTKKDIYKFIKNFRFRYSDIRVNSPYIEFAKPDDYNYFSNNLKVDFYDDYHRYTTSVDYKDEYQILKPNGGVLQLSDIKNYTNTNVYVGPDGNKYYTYSHAPGSGLYITQGKNDFRTNEQNIDWLNIIKQRLEQQNRMKELTDKLNVFLYYEIYDTFCRKYGYSYEYGEYTSTKPMEVKVNYNGNYNKNEYTNFYNKYKDYISGVKSPSYEYLQAKKELENKNITVDVKPERKEIRYYEYLDVKAPKQAKEKEVEDVYLNKQGKVKPQPYSVQKTVSYYKTLTKTDVKMILENLQNRLNTSAIEYSEDCQSTSLGKEILTDKEIKEIYLLYEFQPEKFREYAKELDMKYSKYYPQNL